MNNETLITQPIDASAFRKIARRAGDRVKRPHPLARPVAICIALTVLADWFFYRHKAGWTTGIYLLILLLAILATRKRVLRFSPGRITAAALLGLSLALMSQPGPLSLLLGAAGILFLAMLGRLHWCADASVWARRFIRFLFTGWISLFHDKRVSKRWHAGHGGRSLLTSDHIKRWFLPLLLTFVFVWLFAVANPLVDLAATKTAIAITQFFSTIDVRPSRILFWLFCTVWLWALLRVRPTNMAATKEQTHSARQIATPSSIVRCLALFNIVFAAQSCLDLLYLWGGLTLPAGMTYAHYAHRGAYPLIVTALLAAAFVLMTFRDGFKTREMSVARRLVYIWLAQNVFLTFSAIWRLKLYIEVYSLTRWRVAAAIWMMLVAAGLIWIAARILFGRTNSWLINANVLTAILVLYCCCFINFNNLMAWYNVRHCREINHTAAALDLQYLVNLGPESLPAIEWLLRQPLSTDVTAAAQRTSVQLRLQLRNDLSDWRGWSYRRHELKSYL